MYEPQDSPLLRYDACDALGEAITAVEELRDVTKRSIANDYNDVTSPNCRESFKRALGRGFSYLNILFAPVAFIAAITATSHAGQPTVAFALSALMFPAWMGPAMYFDHIDERERKPSYQFAVSNKKLSAAISRVPEGRAKGFLEDFRRAANRVFALGEIAAVQEKIAHASDGQKYPPKLLRKGLRLIDNAASGLEWDKSEHAAVTAAFNARALPPPHRYVRMLDEFYWDFQQQLSKMESRFTIHPRCG